MLLFSIRIVDHLNVVAVGNLHTKHNQIIASQIDEVFFYFKN